MSAQSENVNLLNNIDEYAAYSDVWGWDDLNTGTELAIVGAHSGVTIIDATNPATASEVGFIPGANSIWRDMKTYGDYLYITNEDGNGLQIVDLSDPLNPQLVNSVTTQFTTAHNVWIDEVEGLLFAVGCDFDGSNQETNVYDLTADPVNPIHLYNFTDYYVHDMYSQGGIGFLSAVYDGVLATVDLSLLPGSMPVLDTEFSDDAFNHNVWTTEDGNYALTTDEVSGGHITVFDVADPGNISVVGNWTNDGDPNSIVHNVTVRGDYAYIAWYKSGLQILDVSNPPSPTRVGYYDTFAGSGDGFDGAWGVYPFAPSGNVYVSDITNGLFILGFDPNFGIVEGVVTDAVTTNPLSGVTVSVTAEGFETTTDTDGYYRMSLSPGAYDVDFDLFGYQSTTSNVSVSVGGTTTENVALDPLPTGTLSGTVTESGSGDPLANARITVLNTPLETTTDGSGNYSMVAPVGTYDVSVYLFGYVPDESQAVVLDAQITDVSFTLDAATIAVDFESGDGGFSVGDAGDTATTGIWEREDPIGTSSGGTPVQPEDDHTPNPGVQAWFTGQGSPGGSIGENDVDGGKTTLKTGFLDLSAMSDPVIEYHRWYSNNAGVTDDVFRVDVSVNGGQSWTNLETLSDTHNSWERVTLRLGDFGVTATNMTQVRFVAEDGGQGSIVEAAIDDVQVYNLGVTVDVVDSHTTPTITRLLPASPNPFRSGATIRFVLAEQGTVTLEVFDVQGRAVRQLVNGALAAGPHAIAWDGLDTTGRAASPGVYLARLVTADAVQTLKLVRAR